VVPIADALAELRPLLVDPERLVRAVAAGRRRGSVPAWRKVELRPVELKAGRRLQVVAYDEQQAHTRNEPYGPGAEAAVDLLLAEPFGSWRVETSTATVQLRVTKSGGAQVHRAGPPTDVGIRPHDRARRRLLDPSSPVLRELGLTDAQGRVRPARQDKYTQVEELLRALDAVLDDAEVAGRVPAGRPLQVVDLGCGNGYLTFAAHEHLTNSRGLDVRVTGVDVKAQAVGHGERVAAALGVADSVRFVRGAALEATVEAADVVLALHACDTATDDALARAVRWGASVVLASPCCHHDVQRQLSAARATPAPYGLVTRHGILRERLADLLTDALRAGVLRREGYRVEIVEFVGSRHTPRNTLIRAVRTGAGASEQQAEEYDALVRDWAVTPRLAQLLADG
jgi:SAM-dependent methyltransferase